MGNLSIGQLFILVFISILMFGDLNKIFNKIAMFVKNQSFFHFYSKKNRKKGS